MKRILLFVMLATLHVYVFANVDASGHFRMDVSDQNISINSIDTYFEQYLSLPENTTFTIFRDETDPSGFRHLSYQQYVDGTKINNGIVLVHSLNDVVISINGNILTREQHSTITNQSIRISRKQALKKVAVSDDEAPIVFVKVLENGVFVYHKAYKIKSDYNTCYKYVDVFTGEIIKKEELVYNADVEGTAYTLYNGIQSFTCYNNDGVYYLHDAGRNFVTYDATNADPIDYTLEDLNQILEKFRLSCSEFSNTATTWKSPFHRYLTKISISALPGWSPQVGDLKPDLYLKIFDSSGNLLYTTGYKEDVAFPTTYTIPAIETLDGYLNFQIYDYDPIGDDDYLGMFSTPIATSIVDIPFSGTLINGTLHFEDSGIQPALDIHWGMQKTMDYYYQKLNRNGHDNKGSLLYQFYNPAPDNYILSTMPSNAFAYYGMEPNIMVYGSGMASYGAANSMRPVVSLDVMAHEFTHLVTAHNGNGGLLYQDESGALNESFSDIMAMAVVNYAKGTCNWKIGEDIMINVSDMRSMSNPNKSGSRAQPMFYKGTHWATLGDYSDTGDNGGVHTNSGVQNYWFYLLANGGMGTNEDGKYYSVGGIGIDNAVKIAYYNLLYYLTPDASYIDARWGAIQACAELYGNQSSEMQSVIEAWYAVGVGEKDKTLPSGKYVIVAACEDEIDWFMSSDITSTSTKRLVADTLALKDDFYWRHTDPKFVWNVTRKDDGSYTIDNNGNYLSWTSGNSASLSTTPKEFGIYPLGDEDDLYAVQLDVPDAEPRFLSYNTANGLHYFAFYQNTNQHYNLYFIEVFELDSVTIRAKLPSAWGEDISCWVWYDGYIGEWKTPTKNGDWYEYSDIEGFNIIFVNGTTWSNDNNQTNDILSVYEDICIQVNSNTSGKRNYTQIDCPESEPTQCEPLPYIEPFSDSQGAFTEQVITGANGLTKMWTFTSAYGMKISGRVSGTNYKSESWLISPCVNLTTAQKPILSFSHTHKFAGTPTDELTLWISTNYIGGTPSSSTWKQLTIPTYATNTDWTFVSSGDIDLSAFIGHNVNIAWKYTSTASYAATWEIKNVVVKDAPQTSNLSTATQNVVALGNKSKIDIFGTQAGDNIDVYSAAGICILHTTATSDVECVSVPAGFYLVKIGQRTHKVVVR